MRQWQERGYTVCAPEPEGGHRQQHCPWCPPHWGGETWMWWREGERGAERERYKLGHIMELPILKLWLFCRFGKVCLWCVSMSVIHLCEWCPLYKINIMLCSKGTVHKCTRKIILGAWKGNNRFSLWFIFINQINGERVMMVNWLCVNTVSFLEANLMGWCIQPLPVQAGK